jgi:hypothetical protein
MVITGPGSTTPLAWLLLLLLLLLWPGLGWHLRRPSTLSLLLLLLLLRVHYLLYGLWMPNWLPWPLRYQRPESLLTSLLYSRCLAPVPVTRARLLIDRFCPSRLPILLSDT